MSTTTTTIQVKYSFYKYKNEILTLSPYIEVAEGT